jgi:hypothetical protein
MTSPIKDQEIAEKFALFLGHKCVVPLKRELLAVSATNSGDFVAGNQNMHSELYH